MENSSFQKGLTNFKGESLFSRLCLLFASKDRAVERLISSIRPLCRRDDTDELSSRIIIQRVKDFMSMIPRDDEHKAMKYFQQFWLSDVSQDIVSLLESPVKAKREAGEESIKVFLTPNINFLPKNIRNYCARIVGDFCMHLRPPDGGTELPLYRSCRNTYRLLLKSIGYRNKKKYLYGEEPHQSMAKLTPFVTELANNLCAGLKFIEELPLSSELPKYFRSSFEKDLREFTLFSLHLRKAIEYHIKSKGLSIPVNSDEQLSSSSAYIESFYLTTSRLNCSLDSCLLNLELAICHSELKCGFNQTTWLYYLSIMKEVNYISKLFREKDIQISEHVRDYQLAMTMLIIYSKRSGEHQWILEYRNLIDARLKRCLVKWMFPRVNFDTEKRHSILIDRSQLLSASFEQIAHASPKLLRSCLEVEFEHETASGPGVLREWLFLVCQGLFHPDNSLFLACPSDRRRFFPNPATLDQRRLKDFTFCGRVIALALMYKVQVGIAFDRVFFKQLSREAVSLEDVRCADPCLYNSCKKILKMDADLVDSDIMGLTFINETQEFGFKRVVELCPGGEAIAVNSNNREEYIRLLIQSCFVKPISDKVAYFARGFGDILLKPSLQEFYFQSLELNDLDDMLFGTDTTISVQDWKAHTDYNDYQELDDPICWFWKVVEGLSAEQKRGLLYFWTSVRYLSVKGFSSLESRLCICKTSSSHCHLPSSHTCVYTLDLPNYPSLDIMEERLLLICRDYACYSFGDY